MVNLKPGDYHVEVQASLFPDQWQEDLPDDQRFVWIVHVKEPWWRTTGLYVLLGAVLLALLIVNFFFGPLVNSAMEPAYQVENFSVTSVNRLSNAASPQINRNYGGGNVERSVSLVTKMSRYSELMMTVIVFTALVELDFVLDLWLKDVPDGALLFTQWTLVSALVRSFVGGTQTLEQASGRIKWFQICNSIMSLACLPIAFVAYKWGAPAPAIILVYIGYSVTYRILEFWLLHRLIGFKVGEYIRKAYIRPLIVVLLMAAWFLAYRFLMPASHGIWLSLTGIAATFLASCLSAFFIGLYPWERELIFSHLRRKYLFLGRDK